MRSGAASPDPTINAPVMIQDMLVVGEYTGLDYLPMGEFNGVHEPNSNPQQAEDNLFAKIEGLLDQAAAQHIASNFYKIKTMRTDSLNHVTRLVTNEFFFYTKSPLTLRQFEALMQRVATLAANYPVNLHAILGSFAVLTPDNRVMNVAVQLEAGETPIFNLTIKNYPSAIDPAYKQVDAQGIARMLPNISHSPGHAALPNMEINIDSKPIALTFNNIFVCNTAGGAQFNSCIELCLDHALGTGKRHFAALMNDAIVATASGKVTSPIPKQCSHVVLSNYVHIKPEHCIGGLTHVDPIGSLTAPKPGAAVMSTQEHTAGPFGTNASVILTHFSACPYLTHTELALVTMQNSMQNKKSMLRGAYPGQNLFSPSYTSPQTVTRISKLKVKLGEQIHAFEKTLLTATANGNDDENLKMIDTAAAHINQAMKLATQIEKISGTSLTMERNVIERMKVNLDKAMVEIVAKENLITRKTL